MPISKTICQHIQLKNKNIVTTDIPVENRYTCPVSTSTKLYDI